MDTKSSAATYEYTYKEQVLVIYKDNKLLDSSSIPEYEDIEDKISELKERGLIPYDAIVDRKKD